MSKSKVRKVNKERRNDVIAYTNKNYSILELLRSYGALVGNEMPIKCPLHADSRPSFYVDSDNNTYKCFSCNSGKYYVNLYDVYNRVVVKDGKTFNQHIEELLKSDPDMQTALKFSTIYVTIDNDFSFDTALHMRHRNVEPTKVVDHSEYNIARKLQGNQPMLLDFYADVERGMSQDMLWSKYILGEYTDVSANKEVLTALSAGIEAILEEEDDEDEGLETNIFD